jgi:hypothetical protein
MRSRLRHSGFALTITLVLMVLIAIVVVAYLVSTRIERSSSSVYANRLRAKIQADSGLAAAIHLLKDNTRYGNYITAMPAPVPAPASTYTEIYRPADPTDTHHGVKSDDYLQVTNAAGEILTSRAIASSGPGPDTRPDPQVTVSVTAPNFQSASSYDFNQIVTIGSSTGRLVQPSPAPNPPPAYGQWVNVRDVNSQLIGRYAFFMEDESMKVNVNYAGNNLGASGSNLRVNDLAPLPASTPASQIQEIDPSGILPTSSNRATADTNLMNLGAAGTRLLSPLTLGFLGNWNSSFPDYAHLATVFSRDDDSTARGWQRLNINSVVASTDKVSAATRIANWIRDAWTGPTLTSLQTYQLFGDDRLRRQVAANIVDYIAPAGNPTDMGNVMPSGGTSTIPVIGIEKIPYLGGIFVTYESSGHVAGGTTATIKVKFRFNFFNLYESALTLTDSVKRIDVQGIPVVLKNGASVLDLSTQSFSVQATSLTASDGSGSLVIPAAVDGSVITSAGSGVRSFDTPWVSTNSVTFPTGTTFPVFQAGNSGQMTLQVKVYGDTAGSVRLDDTAAATITESTGYKRSGGSSTGDFLGEEVDGTNGPLDISAVYLQERNGPSSNTEEYGDPRYRPANLTDRWLMSGLTDNQTLSDRLNLMNTGPTDYPDPRTSGVDWFDYYADRPLAFLRNGPLVSIGEIGNVCFSEYPWRTGYLQHPDRFYNGSDTTLKSDITNRRTNSVDYVLIDLFRTQNTQPRSGAININTQLQLGSPAHQQPLGALFLGVPIGTQSLTLVQSGSPDTLDRIINNAADNGSPPDPSIAAIINRRTTVTADNTPPRPFFQIGELASPLSRLVNWSPGGTGTTGTPARSTVSYSLLRAKPTTKSQQVEGRVNGDVQRDIQVEQFFREVSNSITTRGNVFRVLYVGQTLKAGIVEAEYLGEAFVERQAVWSKPDPDNQGNSDIIKTSDSNYKIIANRIITE